jgi:hypothetical protein
MPHPHAQERPMLGSAAIAKARSAAERRRIRWNPPVVLPEAGCVRGEGKECMKKPRKVEG